jgi:hypothetical protein
MNPLEAGGSSIEVLEIGDVIRLIAKAIELLNACTDTHRCATGL